MDTLRRLFFYTWRYRKLAFLAYGALAGSALLSLVIPRLFGNVVNVVVEALEKDFYIFAGSVIEAVDGTSCARTDTAAPLLRRSNTCRYAC